MIRNGRHYRWVDTKRCFRVFEIAPDEDYAIVARVECSSTRLKFVSLSQWNAALAVHRLIPVEIVEEPRVADETRSPAAAAAFEKILPALQALLAPGYYELARTKMWPSIVREAEKIKLPPSTLNWAFTQVIIAGGEIDAAAPQWHKCGRKPSSGPKDYVPRPTNQPGSYHLERVDFENIAAGVRSYFRMGATWEEAYEKFLEEYYPAGEKIVGAETIITVLPERERPSPNQFKWHGMRLVPLEERLTLQHGEWQVSTNERGRPTGQSGPAIYPGVVSEIDWTVGDIVGVARGNRLSIGRFCFYAMADVQCGIIQAAHLSMNAASAAEAGNAILQCLEDKPELCRRSGLVITKEQWNTRGLPIELRSDRGEINTWKATGLGTRLGMTLVYCATRRPDQKGTIESFFRVVRYFLRRLRGGTSGFRERLKDHPNVTAIYDFDQVQCLLYTLVIKFNARVRRRQAMTPGMVASGVLPVPNLIYKWAEDRGCIREFALEKARVGVLPTHFAPVTVEGIKLKGLRYVVPDFNPEAYDGIDANDWLMGAKRRARSAELGIDSKTVNYVWLRHRLRNGNAIEIKCPLSAEHSGWLDMSWVEYGLNQAEYSGAIKRYEEGVLRETRAWARASISSITAKASRQTTAVRAGMTATEQIAGSSERRADEMSAATSEAEPPVNGLEFFDAAQWGSN